MYRHIMVPLDGSKLAECVLPHVQAIAAGCNTTDITLVRVVEPLRLHGGLETKLSHEEQQRLIDDNIGVAKEYLQPLAKQLTRGLVEAKYEVLFGDVVDKLVDYVTGNNVDLIVIATHGRSGISRWAFGSTADRMLRSSCVPVFLVRAPGCVSGI